MDNELNGKAREREVDNQEVEQKPESTVEPTEDQNVDKYDLDGNEVEYDVGKIGITAIEENLSTSFIPSDERVNITETIKKNIKNDESTMVDLAGLSMLLAYSSAGINKSAKENFDINKSFLKKKRFDTISDEKLASLKNEDLLLVMSEDVNDTSIITISLDNSCVDIYIKAPINDDYITLEKNITDRLIQTNLSTGGAVLSNMDYIVIDAVLNTIESLYKGCSIKSKEGKHISFSKLKTIILLNDVPVLLATLLDLRYPNGYDFTIPCNNTIKSTGKDTPCTSYIVKNVRFKNFIISKRKYFDEESLAMLKERKKAFHTVQQVEDFKAKNEKKSRFTIDTIEVLVGTPTVKSYLLGAGKWLGKIESNLDNVLDYLEEKEKNKKIENEIKASSALIYLSRIRSMKIRNVTKTDDDFFELAVKILITKDENEKEFFKQIFKFEQEATCIYVGVPDYKCKQCKLPQEGSYNNFVGLNLANLFLDFSRKICTEILRREQV